MARRWHSCRTLHTQQRDLSQSSSDPKANTLLSQVTGHNNTSVSYRRPYLKCSFFEIRPLLKSLIFLLYPKVSISSFNTYSLSAHGALKPNHRESLRKQNRVFHDITSTLDILHKQVVQGTGFFYSGLSNGPLYIERRHLQVKKCKKHYCVVSRANQHVSLFHFSSLPSLLGCCGFKIGPKGEVEPRHHYE